MPKGGSSKTAVGRKKNLPETHLIATSQSSIFHFCQGIGACGDFSAPDVFGSDNSPHSLQTASDLVTEEN